MKITHIYFEQFRSFPRLEVKLGESTLLVGGNGAGKTSVVEGLHLLSHGESFRAEKIDEMIAFGQPLARVGARLVDESAADMLEMTLTRGLVQGRRAQKRLYALNGARKKKLGFVGKFFAVVFQPEDMRLVEGSPGRRRRFIDSVLSLTSADYARSLHTYEQALKRYNRLIDQVRDRKQPVSVLKYWELLLVKHGELLQRQREEFFAFIRQAESPFAFDVRYLISPISERSLDSHRDRAIAAGHALVGPHKDDFEVLFPGEKLENRELSAYGSRGQQRLGVLWLKLGELQFLEQKKEQQPLLLLDDIFSELDEQLEGKVLELVGQYQTVMTTANKDTQQFLEKRIKNLSVVKIGVKAKT
jgi:DNA replication and repair protein RecF